ncbi:MAG TPA: serine/threonine-protein kinase [Polyangia bacterium]|nr:serine/threonine-protein kinase [Polyangia bacterium]
MTQISTFVETDGGATEPVPGALTVPIPSGGARYQPVGELGRGGMGTVYSVRDMALLRHPAMKVLSQRLAQQSGEVDRFLREARITAQLDHPNIAPVYDVGMDTQGNLFFTMKRVEGRTLHDWISEVGQPSAQPDALREMLDTFLHVCDAVAFAHSRGVIHCDIKPENVMVGPFGQVYLMDWGVARVLEESRPAWAPRLGTPVGTPSFMSPEQASGDPLDERSDVFTLGALLYTILTGRAPFDAEDARRALAKARACEVAFPPGMRAPTLLCDIVLRAMAKDPASRFDTAVALRNQVEASLHVLPFSTATFQPGARIVVEGEPGDSAYIIVSGSCIAYKTVDGARRVLRRLPAGSVFGETAVLSGRPRTATVEAETEVVVNVVSRALLEQHLGLGTRFGAFVVALAERFRELDEQVRGGGGGADGVG